MQTILRCSLLLVFWAGAFALAADKESKKMKVYGVGILGNCCTHGAGLCGMFTARNDTRVVAAYEAEPRRAAELCKTFGKPLAKSYDEVINHPEVDFVAVSCDPCDKADMVEKAETPLAQPLLDILWRETKLPAHAPACHT